MLVSRKADRLGKKALSFPSHRSDRRWVAFSLLFSSGFLTAGGLASLIVSFWIAGIVGMLGGIIGLMMAALFQVAGLETADETFHAVPSVSGFPPEEDSHVVRRRSEWIRCVPAIDQFNENSPRPRSVSRARRL